MASWGCDCLLTKVSLAAWPTNHPAIGLYARYGFRVEGTRRRHYRRRSGALWDSVVMGLVLDEEAEGGPGRTAPARPPIVTPEGGIRGLGSDGTVLREWRRGDIPALVAEYRVAGMQTGLAITGDPDVLSSATGLALYRIAEELAQHG